jgi:hypothetical protein
MTPEHPMAFFKCPECQREISDRAVACPACGFPRNRLQAHAKPPQDQTEDSSGTYYLLVQDKEEGPFSLSDLREMMVERLSPETLFARDGMTDWKPLKTLFPADDPKSPTKKIITPLPDFVLSGEAPPEPKRTGPLALGCAVIAGIVGAVFLFAAIAQIFESPASRQARNQDDTKFDAYYTATVFIKKTYPGAQNISSYSDSIVEPDGGTYRVAVTVDGLNAFGGPIRKMVGVEMHREGTQWKLDHIEQR